MTNRLGVYLVGILAGTTTACGVDTSWRLTPVGDAQWAATVDEGIAMWRGAMGACGFPLVVETNGMPVTFYPPGTWPNDSADVGLYTFAPGGSGLRIDVRGPDRLATLAHEMGHAIGLGHSADPGALMYAGWNGVQSPQPGDVADARHALGCD